MKRLWSPWRSAYIYSTVEKKPSQAEEGSLFTRLYRQQNDEENLILWRGKRVFVMMNLYPYNSGHVMIIPIREVAEYDALTPEEQAELASTLARVIRWLKKALKPEGFNVGMNIGEVSGAGIPEHVHIHVVPRWAGDTNFMPTTCETKVISEALKDTYYRIRAVIQAEASVQE